MNKLVDCSLDEFFQKKFSFNKVNDWRLSTDFLNENIPWNLSSLTVLKQELNATKSLLNDKGEDWHSHTAIIDKAAHVIDAIRSRIQPELLTKAWCKFYEILSSFNLFESESTNIRSLHLCEAPGAFISALNYYLCLNHPSVHWEWMANTLNPYYEGHGMRSVVVDDRLLFPTLKNWYFGKCNTGNITDSDYIDDLCNVVEKIGLFHLVTADGSFDCLSNPGEQELFVAELHFMEVLVALSSLLPGGCFVLKKFTFLECVTISQLYILNCIFEKIHIFKPFTSRSSNSEVYVICIGFNGSEVLSKLLDHYKHVYRTKKIMAFYSKSEIPKSFLQQLEECSHFFANLQITAIKQNIALHPIKDDKFVQKLNDLKESCAEAFVQKYSLRSCALYDACKLYSTKKKIVTSFYNKTKKDHKSIYFQAVGDTFNNLKKSTSLMWQEKLTDVENRINNLFPVDRKRTREEIEWAYPWKEIRKKMKSKNFHNWLASGKRISSIQNSKFCYPVILYLWNQVAHNSQIDIHSHTATICYWPLVDLVGILRDESCPNTIVPLSPYGNSYENDRLLSHLEKDFSFEVVTFETQDTLHVEDKFVYVNTTTWTESLHQECLIKSNIIEMLITALQILKRGDNFILCIQSLLTRYSAGLIFIILSLFEKFTHVLPENSAPACIGQIWIFKDFHEPKYLGKTIELLSAIKQLNNSETNEVLEIIPMSSLCGGLFHIYLRDVNNKHLLQRLRSLITTEKCKIQKS